MPYITNISAVLDRNEIIIKWAWAKDCVKVDVQYLWRGKENRMNEVYKEEYAANENQFTYKLDANDHGILKFRLVPYRFDIRKNLVAADEPSEISVASKAQEIGYSVEEKIKLMTLSEYKPVYVCFKSAFPVNGSAIMYRKSNSKCVYSFPSEIKKGESRWGPVFIKKNESITLYVAEEYRGIYILKPF